MKSFGYLVSIVSVFLLAMPAWENASQKPMLMLSLVAGMALSMVGMVLRWWSYRREDRSPGS